MTDCGIHREDRYLPVDRKKWEDGWARIKWEKPKEKKCKKKTTQ